MDEELELIADYGDEPFAKLWASVFDGNVIIQVRSYDENNVQTDGNIVLNYDQIEQLRNLLNKIKS